MDTENRGVSWRIEVTSSFDTPSGEPKVQEDTLAYFDNPNITEWGTSERGIINSGEEPGTLYVYYEWHIGGSVGFPSSSGSDRKEFTIPRQQPLSQTVEIRLPTIFCPNNN